MDRFDGKGWHDMGGDAAGPLPMRDGLPVTHDYALWEKRVDALMVLMASKGHFTVDRLRRAIEDMGPNAFETMSYYDRWIGAVNRNLVEGGVYSLAELGAKMEQVAQRGATYGQASDDRG